MIGLLNETKAVEMTAFFVYITYPIYHTKKFHITIQKQLQRRVMAGCRDAL